MFAIFHHNNLSALFNGINLSERDDQFMFRCIQLAELGAGNTAPNPMVGAVLVYRDTIIGEGYHEQYGGPHAEVNCIATVDQDNRSLISQSTLYVSLEPCAHFGKTPPCADLIIRNKIPTVVIGCRDPFKEVNGRGIEKLVTAGVEVRLGILEEKCRILNRRFFTFTEKKRPYVILKWAQSADAKIGNHDVGRMAISNELTNRLVHKWRSEESAIMVGSKTALIDDPSLTVRLWKGKDPVRIVIDRELQLPHHLKVFQTSGKTIIFNFIKHVTEANIYYHRVVRDQPFIPQVLDALHHLQFQSILVEGGSRLLQLFIGENCWDEARIITNNSLFLQKGVSSPLLKNSSDLSQQVIGNDLISTFKNNSIGL